MNFNKSWTLFLDRDGVINEKIENDYVKSWSEFTFVEKSVEAISFLSKIFGKIILVTNQRGVGRGLMSELDLISIHKRMIDEIKKRSGRIDKIYYCTDVLDTDECRKPNTGMAILAKNAFPEIDFTKSIIVGDSSVDIEFGRKLGFTTVFINSSNKEVNYKSDFKFNSLHDFAQYLNTN